MKFSATQEARLKSFIAFLVGLTFLAKFAFWTPDAINPMLTMLIAALIFGPAVLTLWKGESDDKP